MIIGAIGISLAAYFINLNTEACILLLTFSLVYISTALWCEKGPIFIRSLSITALLCFVVYFYDPEIQNYIKLSFLGFCLFSILSLFKWSKSKRKSRNLIVCTALSTAFSGVIFIFYVVIVTIPQQDFQETEEKFLTTKIAEQGELLCEIAFYQCEIIKTVLEATNHSAQYLTVNHELWALYAGGDTKIPYIRMQPINHNLRLISFERDKQFYQQSLREVQLLLQLMMTVWLLLALILSIVHDPKSLRVIRKSRATQTVSEVER